MMGQLSRFFRFSGRFLVDRKYRNHVLDVVGRHVRAGEDAEAKPSAGHAPDNSWLSGRKMFLVGGCELTYIKDCFDNLGVQTHHTFDHGGAPEPLGEASNPASPLWKFAPDIVLLSQVQLFRGLVQKVQTGGRKYTREEQEADLTILAGNALEAIRRIRERLACPVFLMTYPLVYRPAFGIHEYRSMPDSYSLAELIRAYELRIYDLARQHPDVYVLDVNLAFEHGGKRGRIVETEADGVYEHFTREGAADVSGRLLHQLSALEGKLRRIKCVVVDLDGTLWSGVLREDGPSGVAVRVNHLTVLGHLARRGIVLAICSKNDEAELEHLPALLGSDLYEKFVAKRLNWRPKSENLRAIAKELNIGLDSLAFFDDSPFEREEVKANAPEVLVLEDEEILGALLRQEFEPFGEITAEATSRTAKYVEQSKREEAAASAGSMEDFLRSCQLRLVLRRPAEGEMSRVHELLQRTNQLNATLRRSSLAELQNYVKRPADFETRVALLQDKFGDYGLIGLGIAAKDGGDWSIVELAFSCRAMAKGVEEALLLDLSENAARSGAHGLSVDFRRTDRNQQLLEILRGLDFQGAVPDVGSHGKLTRPIGKTSERPAYPPWLEIER
jgi:FkbH-like protein